MIVYGDRERRESAADLVRRIDVALATAEPAEGIDRHGALVTAVISRRPTLAGPCRRARRRHRARGAAGRRRRRRPRHGRGAAPRPLPGRGGGRRRAGPRHRRRGRPPDAGRDPDAAGREGTAFYALYPEAIALAARDLGAGPFHVVGIRSIGTTLAVVAAAALEAGTPESLRPVGHPFLRRIEAHPARRDRLLAGGGTVVVVDEGPGLSGSSFGAVADWLEAGGLPRDRLAFLPGHGGDLGRWRVPSTARVGRASAVPWRAGRGAGRRGRRCAAASPAGSRRGPARSGPRSCPSVAAPGGPSGAERRLGGRLPFACRNG